MSGKRLTQSKRLQSRLYFASSAFDRQHRHVVMKAPLSAFDRNCPVACVGSASDDIAILQVASRPNDVWKQCKSANGQQRNNQLIHVNPLGISDHTSPACAPAAAKVPPTKNALRSIQPSVHRGRSKRVAGETGSFVSAGDGTTLARAADTCFPGWAWMLDTSPLGACGTSLRAKYAPNLLNG